MSELCLGAEFSTAEKDGKGMAFRIFTGAKPFPKATYITEIEMLPLSNFCLILFEI